MYNTFSSSTSFELTLALSFSFPLCSSLSTYPSFIVRITDKYSHSFTNRLQHFNMSNFPNKKFDIESDNAKYMCISTANAVGPTVNSTTYLSIECEYFMRVCQTCFRSLHILSFPLSFCCFADAPDDISVSESIVYVQEHHIPGRVICKSQANPGK